MKTHNWTFPAFSITFFSIVSWFTTTYGIYKLTSHTKAPTGDAVLLLNVVVPLVISVLLTSGIQLMLVYTAHAVKDQRGLLKKLFYLIVYFICMSFSVGFGYAFWFEQIRTEDIEKETYVKQVNASLHALAQFKQRYADFTYNLSELVKHSQQQAERESASGDTCDRKTQGIRGPRARQREADAALFANYLPYVNQSYNKIVNGITALETGLSNFSNGDDIKAYEEDLNKVNREANLEWGSSWRNDLLKLLEKRIEQWQGQKEFIRGQNTFKCPDETLARYAETLLNLEINELDTEVTLLDSRDSRQIQLFAFKTLFNMLLETPIWLFSHQERNNTENLKTSNIFPLGLGIIVDLLIFLSVFYIKPSVGNKHSKIVASLVPTITHYAVQWGKEHYIVLPVIQSRERIQIENFLKLHGIEIIRSYAPHSELPTPCKHHKTFPKSGLFNIYKLPSQFMKELSAIYIDEEAQKLRK
jgi:uncharacterized membrane protein SirB2